MDNKLADLIPQYRKLNGIYKTIAEGKRLSFGSLKFIADFHELYGNPDETERAVIDLMCGLEKEDIRFSKMLDRLRAEIENNLSLYETNKEAFDGIDTYNIVRGHVEACNQDIELQEEITREKYRQLMEAEGSLESMVYREHTNQELDLAVNRREHSSQIYQREKAKLDKLYEKRKLTEMDAIPYMEKRFDSIRDMGNGIISIINNYTLEEVQENSTEKADTNASKTIDKTKEKKTFYFNKNLTNSLYKLLVGREFEKLRERDFHKNLNLIPCKNKLEIKKDKKVHVYYIISLLQKLVREKYGRQWLDDFLKENGIEYKVYNSLYKNAVNTKNLKNISPQKKDFMKRAEKCREIIEEEMD